MVPSYWCRLILINDNIFLNRAPSSKNAELNSPICIWVIIMSHLHVVGNGDLDHLVLSLYVMPIGSIEVWFNTIFKPSSLRG